MSFKSVYDEMRLCPSSSHPNQYFSPKLFIYVTAELYTHIAAYIAHEFCILLLYLYCVHI